MCIVKGLKMLNYNLKEEQAVIDFWTKENLRQKYLTKNKLSKKRFYFMDGPPYATGSIHLGTALNKILKDVAIRYKVMRGYDIFAKAGYDTHGVPIESKVQKALDLKTKDDIERFGVSNFIKKCIEFATEHIDDMNKEFLNLGSWMDYENAYITLNPTYIEALWQAFKKAHEKDLLFKGVYPVHFCPQCETALSFNEIEHANLEDTSIYLKYKTRDNRYLLIWTTTPWTLPSNVGVMAHPNEEYVDVQVGNEIWILAKPLLENVMTKLEAGYRILKEYRGKDLLGLKYENPLVPLLNIPKLSNAFRVVLSDRYVTMDTGTGLVHCGSAHGKEDFEVAKQTGLPIYTCLNEKGVFGKEAGKYNGMSARDSNKIIIDDLKNLGFLLFEEKVLHEYPVCWRCDSPLLQVAMPQWFLRITAIRDQLLKNNESVNWPQQFAASRFKDWLSNLSDWPVSRQRYWGTPLPIWVCDKCGVYDVLGTFDELESKTGKKIERTVLGVHKPEIDKYTYACKCRGTKRRVPDVLDVWFDSGASSWGALNYPHEKDLFEKFWPPDLNIEGPDQFRGWWNSQMILSTICFGEAPFKAVLVHGMVLDINKREMHKSQGNALSPNEIIEKYSRDNLRYYMIKNGTGDDFAFGLDLLKDSTKFFNILTNVGAYMETYLNVNLDTLSKELSPNLKSEDLWLISRYNSLKKEVLNYYDNYLFYKLAPMLEQFLVEDFSRKYMKLVKSREDKTNLSLIFGYVFGGTLKLMAPALPHLTEYIYKNFNFKSIHLTSITDCDKDLINLELEKEMDLVSDILQLGLGLREQQKLRLRWTLPKLFVLFKKSDVKVNKLEPTLKSLLNVENIEFVDKAKADKAKKLPFAENDFIKIFVDTKFTSQTKDRWFVSELRRYIQDERKKLKFTPQDKKNLSISADKPAMKILKDCQKEFENETNTKLALYELKDNTNSIEILEHKVKFNFS